MAAGPNSMVALIIPMSSSSAPGKPQPPGTGQQPGRPDNTLPGNLPRPENPIYYPLPPGAPVDPEYGVPEGGRPDNTLPGGGQPPRPSTGPGFPTHPIVLPPSESGGWLPVYIDNTLPGQQPGPDNTLPVTPPDIDLPGDAEWVVGWTPATGWVSVAIIVPDNPVPTPSKKK